MANNHYEEELLAAMKAIADASVATVKFDKTEKATVVDTSKSELGEYRVDNGAMTFTAYSDNKTYIDGDVVYVTIPGGDINQQKIISGKYVSGELEDTSYISPSETFISVTDNLFANQFDNEYALTANGATRMIPIASALIDEVGYNRILISGEFQTWLKHYNLAAGHYGLRIDIEEKKQIDPNRFDSQIHSYYLDVSSMYGDVYNFETFYKQEILCDTSNIEGLITKVSLVFYQLNDFIDAEKKEIEALVGVDNIFVRNIDVRFGFDLANYDGEDVLLYTTKSSTYVDQITPTVKEYFKDKLDPDGPALSDADISGLLEEFNSKDFRIRWFIDEGDRKKVISNISEAPIGTSVHVYRWNLSEGVADFRAGNFWEEILDYKDSFDIKGFKPDSSKREEKIKIIIESPSQEYIEAQMSKDSEFIELSELANKDKTNGELLAKLEAKRNEYISQITRYISNELVFTNESDVVDYTSLDLITGLTIDVDVNGYNGVYMVYDDAGNILAASEGTKSRILSANYTSLVSGDDVADAAEKITWVIPLHNTMIRTPEYGKEYVGPKLIVDTQQLIDNPGTDEVKEYSDRIEITRVGVTPTVGMGEYEPGSAQQIFRIADHYRQTATNNTILCKIVKNRRTYTAAATLSFGPHGVQGTDYSFTLDYENGAIAIPRTKDYIAYIKPHIYNADNFEITDLYTGDAFEWSWYNKRENQNAAVDGLDILNNRPGYGGPKNVAAIRVNTDDVTKLRNYILVCKLKGYTSLASKDGNQQLTLVAYLPIAIKRPDLPNLAIDGAINIKYDTTGGNPKKYDKPYTLQSNETLIDDHGNPYQIDFEREDFITWRMVYDSANCPGAETINYSYYPHVSAKGYLILPVPFMTEGVGTQYSVEAVVKETRSFKNYKTVVKNNATVVEYDTVTYTKDEVLWTQPIRLFTEKYGSALLNAWDGNLTIDEENGIILSAMMGAGIKEDDNSFSGILMGDVKATANDPDMNKIGLYGKHHGTAAFGFKIDGTAFLGKPNKGRILFDGNSGSIRSMSYSTLNNSLSTGMLIDLDDGFIDIKGSVLDPNNAVNDNTHSKKFNTTNSRVRISALSPYFSITSASVAVEPQDIDGNPATNSEDSIKAKIEKSQEIIHIGEDKYFLQSIDFNKTNKTGLKFDLAHGQLNAYDFTLEADSRFNAIDGNTAMVRVSSRDPFFQVRLHRADKVPYSEYMETVIVDENGHTTTETVVTTTGIETVQADVDLIKIGKGNYFLQSANYSQVDRKGIKFDLAKGKLEGFDFTLETEGGNSNSKIRVSDKSPYFQIKDANGATLINISNNNYYLQSGDYKKPTISTEIILDEDGNQIGTDTKVTEAGKGLKINLGSSKIEGYNVLIHTMNGTDSNKYIKIDSGASTYPLRIGSKFRVNWDGSIWATDGTFTGIIKSTAGLIGGFVINEGGIYTKDETTLRLQANGKILLGCTNNVQDSSCKIELNGTDGQINIGGSAIRLHYNGGSPYILVGPEALIQLNGATGGAYFGGDMQITGTLTGNNWNVTNAGENSIATFNKINITAGEIGGWIIGDNQLKSTNGKTILKSNGKISSYEATFYSGCKIGNWDITDDGIVGDGVSLTTGGLYFCRYSGNGIGAHITSSGANLVITASDDITLTAQGINSNGMWAGTVSIAALANEVDALRKFRTNTDNALKNAITNIVNDLIDAKLKDSNGNDKYASANHSHSYASSNHIHTYGVANSRTSGPTSP